MKLKRILTLCCMLTMALGMASSASAADYSFETSANPVYYGSTNYEDLYDAGYNYGARNQIDYDIPEIQYGLSPVSYTHLDVYKRQNISLLCARSLQIMTASAMNSSR